MLGESAALPPWGHRAGQRGHRARRGPGRASRPQTPRRNAPKTLPRAQLSTPARRTRSLPARARQTVPVPGVRDRSGPLRSHRLRSPAKSSPRIGGRPAAWGWSLGCPGKEPNLGEPQAWGSRPQRASPAPAPPAPVPLAGGVGGPALTCGSGASEAVRGRAGCTAGAQRGRPGSAAPRVWPPPLPSAQPMAGAGRRESGRSSRPRCKIPEAEEACARRAHLGRAGACR